MADNPYQTMLGVMGGEAGRYAVLAARTGVVVSLAPLSVRTGDVLLDGADLLIDPRLLPRDRTLSAGGAAPITVSLPGELAVGDRVAMLTPDGETFVVLCKAVSVS